MDEMLKAQLKLSLEVLHSTITFLASPYMADVVRGFCQDRNFYDVLKKVSSAFQALESSCYGISRTEVVKRLIAEVKRCSDMGCVRRVVEEYEEMLGLSRTS